MTSLLIVASRHFQPMKAVDALIWTERPERVIAFGTSAVAQHAVEAAELLGIPAETRELDSGRNFLIAVAREAGAKLAVFVANDVETKKPSQGIAGIMARLDRERISYQRVDSPCTARACETATHLLVEVAKANDLLMTGWRRKKIVERLLAKGLDADDLKNRLEAKLDETYQDAETSPERFAAWRTYLASYETLCDVLGLALASLTPIEAVSMRRGARAA